MKFKCISIVFIFLALCDEYDAKIGPEDVFRKLEAKFLENEITEE